MQKWEYLILRGLATSTVNWYVNGEKVGHGTETVIDSDTKVALSDYFNQLGEEGWELVTETKGLYFVFKRPKHVIP